MATLVLMRHGQSQWNLENRFTGWSDVPLTSQGEADASTAGSVLQHMKFDCAFTSRLMRAEQTLQRVLAAIGQQDVPVMRDSALNERHYGALQGLNKAETAEKYGTEQVQLWRRSYHTRPPEGESIEDCEHRTWPFFEQYILPELEAGKTVLVCAHGNSLRPLIKHFDGLTPEQTAVLEIGLCTPYVYTFEGKSVTDRRVLEVPGIVTQGASLTQKTVEEGRV